MTNSMLNARSPSSIANKALMLESSISQNVLLFVEGISDERCFRKFFCNDNVKTEAAGDKIRAIQALEHYMKNKKKKMAIAIVDADTDHILNKKPAISGLFLTDNTDLLNQAMDTSSLRYVLDHTNNTDQNQEVVRNHISSYVEITSYLRLINIKHSLKLDFKNVSKHLINKSLDDAINFLIHVQENKTVDAKQLTELYAEEIKQKHPRTLMEQGHDLCIALNIYITNHCSSKKDSSCKNIESILLASYDSADFKKTTLYADINAWSTSNKLSIFKI